ncbi:hypothetical protein BD309DRAFT_658147 [Dichomitus squalens]|nr:hypothetical protein BD309DRAFT_658147 [Dichomitus squalens]
MHPRSLRVTQGARESVEMGGTMRSTEVGWRLRPCIGVLHSGARRSGLRYRRTGTGTQTSCTSNASAEGSCASIAEGRTMCACCDCRGAPSDVRGFLEGPFARRGSPRQPRRLGPAARGRRPRRPRLPAPVPVIVIAPLTVDPLASPGRTSTTVSDSRRPRSRHRAHASNLEARLELEYGPSPRAQSGVPLRPPSPDAVSTILLDLRRAPKGLRRHPLRRRASS